MKARLSRRVPFAPTFFSPFHLVKCRPPFIGGGSFLVLFSRITPACLRSFSPNLLCLSHGKNVCVCLCVSKTLACPVWSLRGRPDFPTTDHSLRGDTSSLQRLHRLLFGAHHSGASPLDTAFLFFSPLRYRQERAQSSETGRQDDFRHSSVDADTAISEARCQTRWPDSRTGRNAYHQPTRVA